jgi:rare lipoprotein A
LKAFSMKHFVGAFFTCVLVASGCMRTPPPAPALQASPHYVLGDPYQADGHWYYPAEDYALDATGIAAVLPAGARLTADGEIYDAGALVAAMQTVQLPAIALVTNLENGRQILLRVNDRGPADPGRLIALSQRSATDLLIPDGGTARVRVQIDTQLSHRVVEQVGGGPKLAINTAPAGTVLAEALPPLGAAAGAHGGGSVVGDVAALPVAAVVPERMPEIVHAVRPEPGQLWLRAGTFGRFNYANVLAARLGGLGGAVLRSREGRQESYSVRAGPFATIPEADAALRRALGAGVVDARITVEPE